MERLTYDGLFCDIAMCYAEPGSCGSDCSQRKVWERLKYYEDMEEQGRLVVLSTSKGDLCKDNVMCCDDNCQACANRIYKAYRKSREEAEQALKGGAN